MSANNFRSFVSHESTLDRASGCDDHHILSAVPNEILDIATIESRISAVKQLHIRLRHRLAPFLGKACSGSTRLVDVGVIRNAHHQAIGPFADDGRTDSDLPAAANGTAPLN